jgi:hypothetical protein
MYSTCLFCHASLGANAEIESFPVGRRLAYDSAKGRLWAVCPKCARWNLTPLEERWEAIEECERRFRGTPLRVSTDNVGLAQLREGLELVRIGKALKPEIAAWRYGRLLLRLPYEGRSAIARARAAGRKLAHQVADTVTEVLPTTRLGYDALTWLRIQRLRRRVLDAVTGPDGRPSFVRYMHLEGTELIRPERQEHWRIRVQHDGGVAEISGDVGLRTAGKLLSAINGIGATHGDVEYAIAKLADAGNPDGYFAKIAQLAMRTSWGKHPDAPRDLPVVAPVTSEAERVALHITNRSFWGRGAVGSEPRTALPRLPMVDRLALEMAANEDTERRAMEGELAELEAAWREAEELAAIADGLLTRDALRGSLRHPSRYDSGISEPAPAV